MTVTLLPPWPLLSAFLLASLVLAVIPGPGVLYIVTRSLVQGRRAGLVSVAGVALGNLGNALVAGVGVAALLVTSPIAFTVLKVAGAAYLVFLGLQMGLEPDAAAPTATPSPDSGSPGTTEDMTSAPLARLLCDGCLVALLNPKTALFFAAFLPQFLSPHAAPITEPVVASQSGLLGALFVGIAAITDSVYALAAGLAAPWLGRHPGSARWGRRVGAAIFIGLGLLTLCAGGNAPAMLAPPQ